MSLGINQLGQHVMDFVSITNPEVISVGNIQPGARIRLYDSNMPTTNSYFIGTSNSSFGIWKDGAGATLVGIGTSTPAYTLDVAGNMNASGTVYASSLRVSGVLTSTVATGTAPFTIASTTLVNNLNAQLLNGQNGAFYQSATNLNTGTLNVLYGGTGATGTTGTGTNVLNGSPVFTGAPLAPTASAGTNTTQLATTQFVQTALPAGQIAHFAMSSAPTGWLKANGALVSRTTYARLFTAIGTTFGVGDGSTTFNLPDLRGLFLRGFHDGSSSYDPEYTTRTFGSVQQDGFASHTHTVGSRTNWAGTNAGGGLGAYPDTTFGTGTGTGASGGNETRPKNMTLLACISF